MLIMFPANTINIRLFIEHKRERLRSQFEHNLAGLLLVSIDSPREGGASVCCHLMPGLSVISYVTGCHCSDMSSPHHHTVRIRMVSSVKCSITLPLHVLYRHEHETRGIIPLPCALASCIVWCLMPLIFIWIEAQKMPMNVDVCRVSQKNAWSCFLAITPLWKGLGRKVGCFFFKFRKFQMDLLEAEKIGSKDGNLT